MRRVAWRLYEFADLTADYSLAEVGAARRLAMSFLQRGEAIPDDERILFAMSRATTQEARDVVLRVARWIVAWRRPKQRLDVSFGEYRRLRRAVLERDAYTCVYCGVQRPPKLECDNIIALSRGGKTTMENLATACKPCNRMKRARLVSEWIQ